MRGKFIVIYGINNLGKTTQAQLLVNKLKKEGYKAHYLKYALYNLEPSGPLLNSYLREGNPYKFSSREFQLLQVLNRFQYQPELEKKLRAGINIVAEDYIGTGLAWGIGTGVDETLLKYLNTNLIKEDLVFLFVGKRFKQAQEKGHPHEENQALLEKVQIIHQRLAQEFGWQIIQANQKPEKITQQIWQAVKKIIE